MHAPLAPEKRILLRAADVLRKVGWCQGMVQDFEGKRCAIGAILVAAKGLGLERDAATDRAMVMLVDDQSVSYEIPLAGIFHWNDTPGQTAEEVIERMERVALS